MKKFLLTGVALSPCSQFRPPLRLTWRAVRRLSRPSTKIVTATFTATQPYGMIDQWDNLWTHKYTVTINPETDTFAGVGEVSGEDGRFDAVP